MDAPDHNAMWYERQVLPNSLINLASTFNEWTETMM